MRDRLDISAYLVLGPENVGGRRVAEVARAAIDAGFTCVQVRSKTCSARELIACTVAVAQTIDEAGMAGRVALLVNDRLDVMLAARDQGVRVDGVHVGQDDVPVELCRAHVGAHGIVGLTVTPDELRRYREGGDPEARLQLPALDYFGVGPLRETATKPDCGRDAHGTMRTLDEVELASLVRASPLPLVVGGGVGKADLPMVARTNAAGFFVVSAVCAAADPGVAAAELVAAWRGDVRAPRP
ncbi:thiamine phosphate synthase [Eggerthellaceae bacterium zg-997]|nr:thiamine phosphate synthase [Eggerthellaceae bacterium zg-997]